MGESIHDSLLQVGEVYGVPPPPKIPWRKCETKRVETPNFKGTVSRDFLLLVFW
jgi:hypothetical protein